MTCERCGDDRDYGRLICDECQRADAYWESPITIPAPEADTDIDLDLRPSDRSHAVLFAVLAISGLVAAILAYSRPVALLAGF